MNAIQWSNPVTNASTPLPNIALKSGIIKYPAAGIAACAMPNANAIIIMLRSFAFLYAIADDIDTAIASIDNAIAVSINSIIPMLSFSCSVIPRRPRKARPSAR